MIKNAYHSQIRWRLLKNQLPRKNTWQAHPTHPPNEHGFWWSIHISIVEYTIHAYIWCINNIMQIPRNLAMNDIASFIFTRDLDPAMLRRLEKRILIDLPNCPARREMIKHNLPPVVIEKPKLTADLDYDSLAEVSINY